MDPKHSIMKGLPCIIDFKISVYRSIYTVSTPWRGLSDRCAEALRQEKRELKQDRKG